MRISTLQRALSLPISQSSLVPAAPSPLRALDSFEAAPALGAATRISGAPKGPSPVFTGFDATKLAEPLKLQADGQPKSAKYTFAKLAQASGEMPRTKAEAELWFKQHIQGGLEEAGFAVGWVKGDKALICTRENPGGEVIDFMRGADSNDPNYQALAWQPESGGASSSAPAAGGAASSSAGLAIPSGWRATLDEILAELAAENPELLAEGVSAEQRQANMAALRDKFVAKARGKGLDVGFNKKRGDGPLSIDAVSFRTPQGDGVIDIGAAYDDTNKKLRLQAVAVGGTPGFTLEK